MTIESLRRIVPASHHRLAKTERALVVQRLHDLLRVAILERGNGRGSGRLAGEADLMAEFGVPRDVLREALALLATEGLIERRRGLGTTVVGVSYTMNGQLPAVSRPLAEHIGIGQVAARLLYWGREPVSSVIASQLDGVEAGDDCLCMEYVMTFDGIPMGLITNYLRAGEATGMSADDFDGDFYALLEAHDVDMESYDMEVAAHAAEPRVAELLEIEVGEPIQFLEQSIRSSTGQTFDFAICRFRRELRFKLNGIGRLYPTDTCPAFSG